MGLTLYGIRNCDTVKKARAFLDVRGLSYHFHDYKTAGADPARLADWLARWGWEAVLNRAGTTFRALPDDAKQNLDAGRATALMLANPSMIKRPVLEGDGLALIGFRPDAWAAALEG